LLETRQLFWLVIKIFKEESSGQPSLFFRPEKEGFELMRAALPHLRLLTLPSIDQISLLAKYLTKGEKTYLSMKLLFKEEKSSNPAPPSLNTNSRIRGASLNPNILELIPENLITDSLLTTKLDKITVKDDIKFVCEFNIHHDCVLLGVEILSCVNKFDGATSAKTSKKTRYFFFKILYRD